MSDSEEEEEFSDIEEEDEEEEEEEEESDYYYGESEEEESEEEGDERLSEEEIRRRKAELKGQLEEQIKFEVAEWRKVKEIEDKVLEKLKEKQSKRKAEREEEEAAAAEKKRQEEEELRLAVERKKQQEIDEKARRKKELEFKKMMTVAMGANKFKGALTRKLLPGQSAKPKKIQLSSANTSRDEKAKSQEQRDEEKADILRMRAVGLEDLSKKTKEELKAKAQDLWEQIVRGNTEWYDMKEHGKKLDYDLREMREKWKVKMKQKAMKKGMEPEAFTKKYPPKIQVASKFERREDTRSYGDKKKLFEDGWDVIEKVSYEKLWNERANEFKKRQMRGKKLPKWDPLAPKEKKKKVVPKDEAQAQPTPPPQAAA